MSSENFTSHVPMCGRTNVRRQFVVKGKQKKERKKTENCDSSENLQNKFCKRQKNKNENALTHMLASNANKNQCGKSKYVRCVMCSMSSFVFAHTHTPHSHVMGISNEYIYNLSIHGMWLQSIGYYFLHPICRGWCACQTEICQLFDQPNVGPTEILLTTTAARLNGNLHQRRSDTDNERNKFDRKSWCSRVNSIRFWFQKLIHTTSAGEYYPIRNGSQCDTHTRP